MNYPGREIMGNKNFKRLLSLVTMGVLLVGGISVSSVVQARRSIVNPTPDRIRIVTTVDVDKVDGSVVRAEFLCEIFFSSDGRANGALGLRELGSGNALTLYRIVEGQASDNVYTFSGFRLSPPEGAVTVIFRRLPDPKSPAGTDGSVTFIDTTYGTVSFVTHGHVFAKPNDLPTLTDFVNGSFSYINAPPQTVEVRTNRGSYTAVFENVALVLPSVGAIGWLELAPLEGATPGSNQAFGRWQITNGRTINAGREGKYLFMRARPWDTESTSGDEITILVRPEPGASEPCRIYDIAGSQVDSMNFEAQASITIF
jgi:hypothetical protein